MFFKKKNISGIKIICINFKLETNLLNVKFHSVALYKPIVFGNKKYCVIKLLNSILYNQKNEKKNIKEIKTPKKIGLRKLKSFLINK